MTLPDPLVPQPPVLLPRRPFRGEVDRNPGHSVKVGQRILGSVHLITHQLPSVDPDPLWKDRVKAVTGNPLHR